MQHKMVPAYVRKGTNFSNVKILWDVEINGKARHNRPDITIKEKDTRKWYFVDVTVTQYHNVVMKENKKVNKYLELAEKTQTEHHVKVKKIPIVMRAMDTISKRLKNYFSTLGISDIIGAQTASFSIHVGSQQLPT